jgi:hypothetical protein
VIRENDLKLLIDRCIKKDLNAQELLLPLADLGYGNIRLRSAGLSVGVITNQNKSKK